MVRISIPKCGKFKIEFVLAPEGRKKIAQRFNAGEIEN